MGSPGSRSVPATWEPLRGDVSQAENVLGRTSPTEGNSERDDETRARTEEALSYKKCTWLAFYWHKGQIKIRWGMLSEKMDFYLVYRHIF